MKAADIPDLDMLSAVVRDIDRHVEEHGSPGCGAVWWLIAEKDFPSVPEKIIRTELATLRKRGWLDGCDCGCRGDYGLTPVGERALMDAGRAVWDLTGRFPELRLRSEEPR